MAFLEWAGDKGEMVPATAAARASAVRQILAIEADDLARVDVRALDVDATLERFENLHRTRFSTGSLGTYRSRFRQSVALYLAWLARDPDWKNAGRTSAGTRPTPARVSPLRSRSTSRIAKSRRPPAGSNANDVIGVEAQPVANGLVMYDLPLRPNLLVRLNLPVDLTQKDAERVAAFVRSLAFDQPTSAPPATDGGR